MAKDFLFNGLGIGAASFFCGLAVRQAKKDTADSPTCLWTEIDRSETEREEAGKPQIEYDFNRTKSIYLVD